MAPVLLVLGLFVFFNIFFWLASLGWFKIEYQINYGDLLTFTFFVLLTLYVPLVIDKQKQSSQGAKAVFLEQLDFCSKQLESLEKYSSESTPYLHIPSTLKTIYSHLQALTTQVTDSELKGKIEILIFIELKALRLLMTAQNKDFSGSQISEDKIEYAGQIKIMIWSQISQIRMQLFSIKHIVHKL